MDSEICAGQDPDEWVAAIKTDWRTAELRDVEGAILEYATKLTKDPGAMREADVLALRAAGLSDTAIHDVAQVVALFNYYNRIADGLGIAIDPTV
ncbi:hypothetical protein [Enhygromyxa salina]|uniref:Peroxidase n=1 Tax=Enhygromyxa salina TaxID=215803 RepID=A0A2S9YKB9_9BACT|nr:hypothetical protein [Enhygromyxa salina]PRQ05533.1 hypothetical protein ENSA7_45790 [Enhygromyxa salina]